MDVIPISENGNIMVPDGHILIDSAISGGTYQTYLQEMMLQYDNKVCLYLHPISHRFELPCYNGQGILLDETETAEIISATKFSTPLCCNWVFHPNPPTIYLIDTAFSLQKKLEIAAHIGVPYLFAESSHIKKLRLPD